jgi:hypothetical protein
MHRLTVAILVCALACAAWATEAARAAPADKAWIEKSNAYTNKLLSVELEHAPERGSRQGLAKFDERISSPTVADELAERRELEAALASVNAAAAQESDKKVQEDIEILRKAFDLKFRKQDYALQHEVPFLNGSEIVFQGLRGLLDDQVAAERRPAALVRLKKYTGSEAGYQPITEVLKQRELAQIAKPGVIYPSKEEVQTELGRNSNYVEGIATLFNKYGLKGWEPAYAKLKSQLADYDTWVQQTILPKARTDFRLPPEKYVLEFEGYGIDIPPAKIAAMAHAAFAQYQAEMAPLAAQIAKANSYRLPRGDRGVEEETDHRRGDPAFFQPPAAGDREDHRGQAAGNAAGPPGDHPSGDRRGDCAAAGAAHVAAAVPAQHRPAR